MTISGARSLLLNGGLMMLLLPCLRGYFSTLRPLMSGNQAIPSCLRNNYIVVNVLLGEWPVGIGTLSLQLDTVLFNVVSLSRKLTISWIHLLSVQGVVNGFGSLSFLLKGSSLD